MLFGKCLIDYELCTWEKLEYHIVLVLKPLIKKMLFGCACAHDDGSDLPGHRNNKLHRYGSYDNKVDSSAESPRSQVIWCYVEWTIYQLAAT